MDAHPFLGNLFAALDERRVRWVLLRVPTDFAMPRGDVDLLVARDDLPLMLDAAERVGFVTLPGWETPPSVMLVAYDSESDHWLVLDVATEVAFRCRGWTGPPDLAEHVLARRRVDDGVAVPADADAFWLLLGHCLLDIGSVPPHYRGRLRELAPSASASELGKVIAGTESDATAPDALRDAVAAGDWLRLDRMAPRMAADLTRQASGGDRRRAAAKEALRVARKPLLLPRRRGLSVALLGPNGVGKSTVAAGVARGFPLGAKVVHMGLWKAASANPRTRPAEILTRPFRLWGRSAVAHYHQARGRLVIYDRYVYEARLPAKPPLLAAKRLYFRLLERAVPRPDVAVVLDVPGELAYRRKQENPPDELEAERHVYAQLAAEDPLVELVDASRGPDTVRADVTAIVWRRLQERWRRDDSACRPAPR